MTIKYIDQLDLKSKSVIIRVDYNVPYDKDMKITDDTRITATLPTLKYCIDNNIKLLRIKFKTNIFKILNEKLNEKS